MTCALILIWFAIFLVFFWHGFLFESRWAIIGGIVWVAIPVTVFILYGMIYGSGQSYYGR